MIYPILLWPAKASTLVIIIVSNDCCGSIVNSEAATQIEKLTGLLAETQKSLSEAKRKPVSVEQRSRDPRRLYEDNSPSALTQDPKIDLDKKNW